MPIVDFTLSQGLPEPVGVQLDLAPGFELGPVPHPPIAYKSAIPPNYNTHVLVRTHDGKQRNLYGDGSCSVNSPLAWAPDGSVIYHAHQGLRAIDPNRGSSKVVFLGPAVLQ